jgi:hypothetical protein
VIAVGGALELRHGLVCHDAEELVNVAGRWTFLCRATGQHRQVPTPHLLQPFGSPMFIAAMNG